MTAAPASEAHGWRTPWRGRPWPPLEPVRRPPLHAQRRLRPGGRTEPGAAAAASRRVPGSDPSPCRAVPHPKLPGHSPRGRVTAMPAAAIEQAWRGLGLAPGRPAGSRGAVRAEDGAGASRRQSGGGQDSGDAALTRRWRHPHSRPYKCRAPALLPVGAGPEAGPT